MVRGYQEAALQTRLGIPLLYGADAVHGHNNVRGAVIFPHNIGLGAAGDARLAERIGQITATEALATGIHWVFAPAVSVPQDIRWGRTYEGFSEDTGPGLPAWAWPSSRACKTGTAYRTWAIRAPSSPRSSTFVGDGGTTWGSNTTNDWIIDQGVTEVDEATLRAVHLPPYVAAIEAGARNIMVSLSSWGGQRMHAQRYLLTDVLKGELGFTGFLVSDWQAVDYIDADYDTAVATSINAGVDMVMVPYDGQRFIAHLTRAVEQGDVPLARIDDAVRRILTVKFELGLFERPFGDESLLPLVGSAGPSRRGPRGGAQIAGAAQERRRHAAPIHRHPPHSGRRPGRRRHRPAVRRLDHRLAGQARATSRRARPCWRASGLRFPKTRRSATTPPASLTPPRPWPTWASSSSARSPTPRGKGIAPT